MKNAQDGMDVKYMSDIIFKEIYGICETKNLTKESIKKYKKTEREIFGKYDNFSEGKLKTKSKKNVYVRSYVMTTVIKRCRGEKKEAKEK